MCIRFRNEKFEAVTAGWYKIEPGQSRRVAKTTDRYVYYHAVSVVEDDRITWKGDHRFYVSSKAFAFKGLAKART